MHPTAPSTPEPSDERPPQRPVLAALLRAIVGAFVGAFVGGCGVAVGLARAIAAPSGAPPQAVLQPGGGWTVLRYLLAFVVGGASLGVLWPLRRRSRVAAALLGAAVGALFAVLALPAMDAARPNWPLGPAPPSAPHRWAGDLAGGLVLGALLGWAAAGRGGAVPAAGRRGAEGPTRSDAPAA